MDDIFISHSWAGESSQSTSDGRHKFEEPAFKQQSFGLYKQSNPLPLPWPGYGVQGVSSYCSQGIVSLRADDDNFYCCAEKSEGEHHSISFYKLTSWYDGAACRVPLTFSDPDSCTSRQGGYLCTEYRPEELCPHLGDGLIVTRVISALDRTEDSEMTNHWRVTDYSSEAELSCRSSASF